MCLGGAPLCSIDCYQQAAGVDRRVAQTLLPQGLGFHQILLRFFIEAALYENTRESDRNGAQSLIIICVLCATIPLAEGRQALIPIPLKAGQHRPITVTVYNRPLR